MLACWPSSFLIQFKLGVLIILLHYYVVKNVIISCALCAKVSFTSAYALIIMQEVDSSAKYLVHESLLQC